MIFDIIFFTDKGEQLTKLAFVKEKKKNKLKQAKIYVESLRLNAEAFRILNDTCARFESSPTGNRDPTSSTKAKINAVN